MKKAYVVTRGEYSDYHIVSIFTSRELAEAFKEKYDAPGEYCRELSIEEYTLDDFDPADTRTCYVGTVNKHTGEILDIEKTMPVRDVGEYVSTTSGFLYPMVMADNDDHARKLIVEKYQCYLRVLATLGEEHATKAMRLQ